MTLVAIDPGKKSAGVAIFRHGLLWDCELVRAPDHEHMCIFAGLVGFALDNRGNEAMIEVPRVYPKGHTPNPNDLIPVAVVAGVFGRVLAGKGARVRFVAPKTWKGSVPKVVHNNRVMKKLTGAELRVLDDCGAPASLRHNVVDAVGIGLWTLRR